MKNFVFVALLSVLMLFASSQVEAQKSTLKSVYSVASDTVTNTNTVYLTAGHSYDGYATTIQVTATKISGTVAGTISLQGSVDGTNFKALNTAETQTALATVTATDVASQTFHWRLNGNPFPYYRVSWTGAGTMAASFIAQAYTTQSK